MLKGLRFFEELGILGMNRRNADYIMRCNPRSAFPLVDDKLLTRRMAERHEIPTPSLYHVIEHQGDIAGLEDALEGQSDFVLKPARGSGGSGIVLVMDCTAEGFVNQKGEVISRVDLTYHVSDILSGIYSLAGLEDRALFEALIRPDSVFDAVTYKGVPDIRIVVYRGVPVMAMVRLPTRTSDGKANLHRGAVGVGIDIGRGTTLMGVCRAKIITHHPDTGHPVNGIQVPRWGDMLLIAARAVDMTQLGYVGVDLVIDQERGPLLLELNARPGLQIQIANQAGLSRRLERVDRAPCDIFTRAETRVAWAAEAFGGTCSLSGADVFRTDEATWVQDPQLHSADR